MYNFSTSSPAEATAAAEWILGLVREHKLRYVLLQGDLGAGKTTTVAHVIRLLGSADVATSPTFSLHNSYQAGDGSMILHSDLYRLDNLAELEQTGFFELIDEAELAFIEWADKFALKDMLTNYMTVHIKKSSETGREYVAKVPYALT
jgi:tRNA threonylcarbamoyladenosine biosynthesis protein TsaE